MPPVMTGTPSPSKSQIQSPAKDGISAQKYSVMPPKQEANKFLKGLPENEARQNAKMRSKVSESLGGASRRMKGGLDQFGRPTEGGKLDDTRQEGGTVGALSSSGGVTKDNRNKFDKAFDEMQGEWLNNDDRNDDALYHRSFDDGSMHLYSSVYRDGKPVDNHGKEVGGMSAPAVTKYRRHDLQKPGKEGESATAVPFDEDNSTLRYFAATEMKNHERGWVTGPHAVPWDPAPYRPVPYELRGMKTVTNEPWVEDVKANPEGSYATSSFSRLDDGQNDSVVLQFQRRREENEAIAGNRGLIPWHESPVLWRFPSGQAGRSIEYGETAATLAGEFKYED